MTLLPNGTKPETPTERVAVIMCWLATGGGLTTHDVAGILRLSDDGALMMLNNISRVTNIYLDPDEHVWRICN